MCFFKRKVKKAPIEGNKFVVGQSVGFKRRDDMAIGVIYDIHQDKDGNITYDVQLGGECPVVINGIEESKIHARNR